MVLKISWVLVLTILVVLSSELMDSSFGKTQLPPSFSSGQGFSISGHGAFSVAAGDASAAVRSGFAKIEPDAGSPLPSGFALLGLNQNGVLVSETAVQASAPIRSGRIYTDFETVRTGLAIVNPGPEAATLSFFFSNENGLDFASGTLLIPATSKISAFLDEAPFGNSDPFQPQISTARSFTFSSNVPVFASALRGITNRQSEFLMNSIPVVDLGANVPRAGVIPHFAVGQGWSTQVVVMNPTDTTLRGTLRFVSQGSANFTAEPAFVTVDGQTGSSFAYVIAAHAVQRFRASGLDSFVQLGSMRIEPDSNNAPPAAFAIVTLVQNGIVVSENTIPAVAPALEFRLIVETSGNFSKGEPGSIQTSVAVVNLSSGVESINYDWINVDGSLTGLRGMKFLLVGGQTESSPHQIAGFESLQTPYHGVLRISSAAPGGISVVGLRMRYNERGEPVTVALPAAAGTPGTGAESVFPHIVEGGGYMTQFVLYGASDSRTTSGTLTLFSQTGQPLDLFVR